MTEEKPLELADPAHFYEVALVVEGLGVGFAELVGIRELGAEAEDRQGAVEERDAQDAGLVLARGRVVHDERIPPGFVIRPPELGAQAHGKAPRQRHVGPQPSPVSLAVPAVPPGILLQKPDQAGELHGGKEHVGRAQGEHHEGPLEALVLLVFPVLPGGPAAQPEAPGEQVLHFEARPEIIVEGGAAPPALARGRQQAQFGRSAQQPARPDVALHERLVKLAALVFPVVDVEPRAQAPAVSQGILVFGAAPAHHADIRAGHDLAAPAKRQAVDIDELRVRGRVDVGIRGQGKAEIPGPAPPGPDGPQELGDVDDHGRRGLAGQDPLEVAPGEVVLFLEKEGQAQFQAYAHQAGLVNQDGPVRGNGRVQQGLPRLVGHTGLLRGPDRRKTKEKQHVASQRPALHQPPQQDQRLVEPADFNQGLSFGEEVRGRLTGGWRRFFS